MLISHTICIIFWFLAIINNSYNYIHPDSLREKCVGNILDAVGQLCICAEHTACSGQVCCEHNNGILLVPVSSCNMHCIHWHEKKSDCLLLPINSLLAMASLSPPRISTYLHSILSWTITRKNLEYFDWNSSISE